jgi:hypothetical protein
LGEYLFVISSFAPNSEMIAYNRIKKIDTLSNLYSVGLIVSIGDYNIMLAGDVENETIKLIPDENIDFPFSYIKIPHHGSPSASLLVERLNSLSDFLPKVAVTTVYKKYELPDKYVLMKYKRWNKNMEIYSTGNIVDEYTNSKKFGIVVTTFDVLEKREYKIETELLGNAIEVLV